MYGFTGLSNYTGTTLEDLLYCTDIVHNRREDEVKRAQLVYTNTHIHNFVHTRTHTLTQKHTQCHTHKPLTNRYNTRAAGQ